MYMKKRLNTRKIVQLHAKDCIKDDHVFLSNCTQQASYLSLWPSSSTLSAQVVKFVSTM